MLKFPGVKSVLWDHTPEASPVHLHLGYYRNPRIQVADKVLRLVLRHLDNTRDAAFHCILQGSFNIDEDCQGLTLVLDRFDRGQQNSGDNSLCPTTESPGDALVPFQASKSSKVNQRNARENHLSALKFLHHRCCSKDAVELGGFLLTRGSCCSSSVHDVVSCEVEFEVVCPSTGFQATQINPVPIVPTALSKNLAGPMSLHHLQGSPKSGYLTMDHTRKLLLVLESDPKAYGLPLVGIWISGVPFIYSPFVWACCLRYISNSSIQDRVCEPPEPFLLVLYSPLHSRPEFYECVTTTGKSDIEFSLYSAYESFQLPKMANNGEVKFKCFDTSVVQDGPKRDVFDAAQQALRDEISRKCQIDKKPEENAFVLSMEDITPRVMPSPQPAQMPVIDTMVPEVSLMFHDSDKSLAKVSRKASTSTSTRDLYTKPGMTTTVQSGSGVTVPVDHGPPYSLPANVPSNTTVRPGLSRSGSMPNITPQQLYTDRFNNNPQQRAVLTNGQLALNDGMQHMAYGQTMARPRKAAQRPRSHVLRGSQQMYLPQSHPAVSSTPFQQNIMTGPRYPGRFQHPATTNNFPPHFTQPVSRHRAQRPVPTVNPQPLALPNTRPSTHMPAPQIAYQRPITQLQPDTPVYTHHSQPYQHQARLQTQPQLVQPHVYTRTFQQMPQGVSQAQQIGYNQHPNQPNIQINPPKAVHFQPAHQCHQTYQNSIPLVCSSTTDQSRSPATPKIVPASCGQVQQTISTSQAIVRSGVGQPESRTPNPSTNSQPLYTPPSSVSSNAVSSVQVMENSNNLGPSRRQESGDAGNISNNSCRSSQDSGLSVTPDRPTNKGESAPSSPKLLQGSSSSLTLSQLTDSTKFNNVPPEVYQLLLQQDSQLKQMQAQIQELLKLQLPMATPASTKSTCSVAINTTMFETAAKDPISVEHESTGVQTSPLKTRVTGRVMSPVKHETETPPSKSGNTTPAEVRHRGPVQLNSTAKFDSDSGETITGDLTTMMNSVRLEKTEDSIQSDMIVDLPSYQSSPTRSRASRDDMSESPISASMLEQQRDNLEEEGTEQAEYYNQLMVNIQRLLHQHNGDDGLSQRVGEENSTPEAHDTLQTTTDLSDLQETLHQTVTPSKDSSPEEDKLNSLLKFGSSFAAMDTTFIPKINYVSMFLDSDSDTSMEINAMAMKYLKDEQLTQVAKLRTAACFNGMKNGRKSMLLQQVLQSSTKSTPNVTQYGMSPNDLTMATKKYMVKYGLLDGCQADNGQISSVSRKADVTPKSLTGKNIRPKSASATKSDPCVSDNSLCKTTINGHHSELFESYINVINSSEDISGNKNAHLSNTSSPNKLSEYRMRESLVQKTPLRPSKQTCKEGSTPLIKTPDIHTGENCKDNSTFKDMDIELVGKSQLEIDNILDVRRLKQLPKLL